MFISLFSRYIKLNHLPSLTSTKIKTAAAKADKFGRQVTDEIKSLAGESIDQQTKLAKSEMCEFGCVCFCKNIVPFDAIFYNGNLEPIIARRDRILGWWALALRRLGRLLRFKMQCVEPVALETCKEVMGINSGVLGQNKNLQ